MKTLILILTMVAALHAGVLRDYADSLNRFSFDSAGNVRLIDRVFFLAAMDSALVDWPDSVKVKQGSHGFVFTVRGKTLSEKQMRKFALSAEFIGHSRYVCTAIEFLDQFPDSVTNAKMAKQADKVATKLNLSKEWGEYKKAKPPLTAEERAFAKEIVDSILGKR
jgi:hypothetical protein